METIKIHYPLGVKVAIGDASFETTATTKQHVNTILGDMQSGNDASIGNFTQVLGNNGFDYTVSLIGGTTIDAIRARFKNFLKKIPGFTITIEHD